MPDITEIEATVGRMETRWGGSAHFAAYRALAERFAADLSDPRDPVSAKSAALMMIRAIEEGWRAPERPGG